MDGVCYHARNFMPLLLPGKALALARRALSRARLRSRCRLGEHSVVYEPERIVAAGGAADSIEIGDHTHVRGELLTLPNGRIRIGDYCYVGEQTRLWAAESISVGDRVLIAHLTTILDNRSHPLEPAARHRHYRAILESGHPADVDLGARPVRIEDDAWIGCSVVILAGVTVGKGAVVGAGSVVISDVPPGVLVAGNPARVVRDLRPGEGPGA
jgi:acetyltransferase-like isoleucine patch superfamily enzyme